MKKLFCVVALLTCGLFISENASAQSVARLANADVCTTTVTLNWAGGCSPSVTIPVPALSIVDVPVPCGGGSFASSVITYSGQAPVAAGLGNTPATNCTGGSTLIQISSSPSGFYYFDINR